MYRVLRACALPLLPESVLEGRRAQRCHKDFAVAGVAFVHVPRAAGTSVTNLLYGRFIGHFAVSRVIAIASPEILELPRFTIMRNPWDRLVSAYEFARAGGGRGGQETVSIAHPERYSSKAYANFEIFVRDYLQSRRDKQLDGVFRSQGYYVCDESGAIPFDHVGKLHDIAGTEAWLSELLNRHIKLSRFNFTERTDYRSYYSAQLCNLVGDYYARDVAILGCDF